MNRAAWVYGLSFGIAAWVLILIAIDLLAQ